MVALQAFAPQSIDSPYSARWNEEIVKAFCFVKVLYPWRIDRLDGFNAQVELSLARKDYLRTLSMASGICIRNSIAEYDLLVPFHTA